MRKRVPTKGKSNFGCEIYARRSSSCCKDSSLPRRRHATNFLLAFLLQCVLSPVVVVVVGKLTAAIFDNVQRRTERARLTRQPARPVVSVPVPVPRALFPPFLFSLLSASVANLNPVGRTFHCIISIKSIESQRWRSAVPRTFLDQHQLDAL